MTIEKASVRIMRSYNYNNFEVCLEGTGDPGELRRECQRLVDEALEAYKQAREMEQVLEMQRLEAERNGRRLREAEDAYARLSQIPEEERIAAVADFIREWEFGDLFHRIACGEYYDVPTSNFELPF